MTYCEKHRSSSTFDSCINCNTEEILASKPCEVVEEELPVVDEKGNLISQPPTESWEEMEDILFSLHIRFCPILDPPAGSKEIRHSDCNEVKNELRKAIKSLLSQAEARHREELRTQLEGVINSIPPQYPIQLKASLRAEWLGESKE